MDPAIRSQLSRIEQGVGQNRNLIQQGNDAAKNGFEKTQERFNKLSERLKLPEIINALTLIVTLHNAAMLSQALVQTLGEILSTGLAIIGLKDEEGQPFDVNAILGKQVKDFIISIVSQQVWNNAVARWNAASRVYQAAANVASTVQSIGNSTQAIMEFAAENTGKIGNALKRFRIVGENSYSWMPEQVTPQYAWMQRLENLQDAASGVSGVVGEVASIQEQLNQLKEQRAEVKKSLENAETAFGTDNKPAKARAEQEESESTAPETVGAVSRGPGEE